MIRIVLGALGVALVVGAIAELFLRFRYGLGNPPLYVADARIGYRLAPNQNLRRRGNRIAINQYSMRGPEIARHRPADTLRVLMLGDSIVNGGWWTDQSELLSAKMQAALAAERRPDLPLVPNLLLVPNLPLVEVLNASANSWGPRNQLGYVLRFGTFEAQVVVLVLNTDDLFAIVPNSYELGDNPAYPTRRPPLALWEVARRSQKYAPSAELQALYDQPGDRVGVNLEAVRQLHQTVQAAAGQLVMAMTPLRRELEADGPRDYERVARQRLTDFAAVQGIPYLDFLPRFQQIRYEPLYFDHIHLSAEGNAWVGQALADFVVKCLASDTEVKPSASIPKDEPMTDLW